MLAMRSSSSRIGSRICCVAVVALVLWLSGFGCAFCCATGLTEACCMDEVFASACNRSSAVAATPVGQAEHSCCQRSKLKDGRSRAQVVSPAGGIKGCSLLPNRAISLGILSRTSADSLVDQLLFEPPREPEGISIHADQFSSPPFARNRGGTPLRCCPLMI